MTPSDDFRSRYAFALRRYVRDAGETLLRAAYELGREAVSLELSVLDLAEVHHDVMLSALPLGEGREATVRAAEAAGDFFLESLSSYEMVRRGFRESQEAAGLERRHAQLLRSLSTFLADASLAAGGSASTGEILRLVVEQARELLGAGSCVASVALSETGPRIEAVSSSGDAAAREEDRWEEERGLVPVPPTRAVSPADAPVPVPPAGRLTVPLVALDGRRLGSIEVQRTAERRFSPVDEAVLLHLAQMTAAALERAALYELADRRAP